MSTADVCAAILWIGVTLYAIFGGADFGAGVWDLLAGSGERAKRVREQIDRSIGPVWEANHVWLIFVLVVLWTCFSTAFSAIFSTLYIPLALAALNALPGPGVQSAVRSLVAVCETHGLRREVQVLQTWLSRVSRRPASASGHSTTAMSARSGDVLPASGRFIMASRRPG